ncbi:hypothetical protein DFH27DRAFT_361670 [Peziza echinospora]|nr:hypothetical protein DFH27DRAFT_361670 [Peziza echinospora]
MTFHVHFHVLFTLGDTYSAAAIMKATLANMRLFHPAHRYHRALQPRFLPPQPLPLSSRWQRHRVHRGSNMAPMGGVAATTTWAEEGIFEFAAWTQYPRGGGGGPGVPTALSLQPRPSWIGNDDGPLSAMTKHTSTTQFIQRPMTAIAHGTRAAVEAYVGLVTDAIDRRMASIFREGMYMLYKHAAYKSKAAVPASRAAGNMSNSVAGASEEPTKEPTAGTVTLDNGGDNGKGEPADPTEFWQGITRKEHLTRFLTPYIAELDHRLLLQRHFALPSPNDTYDLIKLLDNDMLQPLNDHVHGITLAAFQDALVFVAEHGPQHAATTLGWASPEGGRMVSLWCDAMRHILGPWTRAVDPLAIEPGHETKFPKAVERYWGQTFEAKALEGDARVWRLKEACSKRDHLVRGAVDAQLIPGYEEFLSLKEALRKAEHKFVAEQGKVVEAQRMAVVEGQRMAERMRLVEAQLSAVLAHSQGTRAPSPPNTLRPHDGNENGNQSKER